MAQPTVIVSCSKGRSHPPSVVAFQPSGEILNVGEGRQTSGRDQRRSRHQLDPSATWALTGPLRSTAGRSNSAEISARVLMKLKRVPKPRAGGHRAVITCPAYFDAQRRATRDAGTIAQPERAAYVSKPTAATHWPLMCGQGR